MKCRGRPFKDRPRHFSVFRLRPRGGRAHPANEGTRYPARRAHLTPRPPPGVYFIFGLEKPPHSPAFSLLPRGGNPAGQYRAGSLKTICPCPPHLLIAVQNDFAAAPGIGHGTLPVAGRQNRVFPARSNPEARGRAVKNTMCALCTQPLSVFPAAAEAGVCKPVLFCDLFFFLTGQSAWAEKHCSTLAQST